MRKIALGVILCLGVFAVWQGWQASQEPADAKGFMNPVSDYLFAKRLAGTYLSDDGGGASYSLYTFGADGTLVRANSNKFGGPLGANFLSSGHGSWKRVGEREIAVSYVVFSIDNNDWGQGEEPGPFFEVWSTVWGVVEFNEDFTEAVASGYFNLYKADQDGDGDVDADDPTPLDDAVPYLEFVVPSLDLRRVPIWE